MTDTLYQALDKARQNFPTIVKNRQNPHFKNRYADLAAVVSAVEAPLREQGLVIFQPVVGNNVETNLVHLATGECKLLAAFSIEGITDPQKVGSAVTYYRRYGLVTGLGLLTEDDDDGNATATPVGGEGSAEVGSASSASRKRSSRGSGDSDKRSADRSTNGWSSPSARAAAHDQLLHRLNTLTEEQKAGLREQVEGMGGMPLDADNFRLVNVAVDLFDSLGMIDTGGQ